MNRALHQLRQLLDFYFEPFSIQHNRYLLDLVMNAIGPPARRGPWVIPELVAFRCTLDDLRGLGRIAAALSKVQGCCGLEQALQGLRHVRMESDGRLRLLSPPEVRTFIHAEGVAEEHASDVVKYLAASREQGVSASPAGVLSVLACTMEPSAQKGGDAVLRRTPRLTRQLLTFRVDVMCLHNFDPEVGQDSKITSTLVDEGYKYVYARSSCGTETNTIFWCKERVEKSQSQSSGSAISLLLQPSEQGASAVRVLCCRPEVPRMTRSHVVPSDVAHFLPSREPVVVCADCSKIGGAECASIVEELAVLESIVQEVAGEELAVPIFKSSTEGPTIVKSANKLNRLHCPDAMLFGGLAPLAVLSGHTEGYLVTMNEDDAFGQFPAMRMPLVAAFDCNTTTIDAGGIAPLPGRRVHQI